MHILIIGAAGMVGRKLTAGLVRAGQVGGKTIDQLTLADVIKPEPVPHAGTVKTVTADLSAPGTAQALIASRPDLIFHLAAIVSGEAEAETEEERATLLAEAAAASAREAAIPVPAMRRPSRRPNVLRRTIRRFT